MKNNCHTREKLLDVAFETFYTNGYNATGLNTLLENAGVQKGSLYHFFASKKDLALAVIRERIARRFAERYAHIAHAEQPLKTLFDFLSTPSNFDLKRGCPLGKLVQELAGLDEDFRTALTQVYIGHEANVEEVLRKAITLGELPTHENDAKRLATFIVIVLSGSIQRARLSDDDKLFVECIETLKKLLLKLD
ncbi:transcriptional regulator [Beggiatoa alba B18LD]|uniref:Transcriptional regulator n=1 Tax=Beggiatoa alba B18LD TaxID=395493 RepID=I3CGR6_9GAMM|nr:TetR/AcrR family transcriptional regulator [Beggiatoa alba]EIJ42809.1 transcriptional regulator [Beggiatoa alba B18LD]